MEENKEIQIVKPQFNNEIEARIKSVGEIESNMKEVKKYVEDLNNYYKNITFTEETMKEAKDEKAKVNKFKKQVSDYRKNIISEYNKPIKIFEDAAKETEQLLTETYNTINTQVADYENMQKKLMENEIRDYFEEYKQSLNIDFIKYEDAKINVTLSASKTSLKKQVKDFVDEVNTDLATITLQEHKDEILVEYKQNGLILNKAIETTLTRIKAIEEEKRKQEEIVNKRLEEERQATEIALNNFIPQGTKTEENHTIVDNALQAPIVEEKKEILTLRFTVRGSRTKLKELKQFLENGGYDYE